MKTEKDGVSSISAGRTSRLSRFLEIPLILLLLGASLTCIVLADSARNSALRILSFVPMLVLVLVIAWNARRQPFFVFTVILFWLLLQNIVLAPLSKLLAPSTIRLLIGTKELLFLLIALSSVLHFGGRLIIRGKGGFVVLWSDIIGLCFILILIVAFVRSGGYPFLSRAAYLRSYAILPLCYFIGRSLPLEEKGLERAFRLTVRAAVFLSVFGFVELMLMNDSFWKKAGIVEFYAAKGMEAWVGAGRFFANWHSWDFGFPLRRMISLILEPTTLGEFLALATLLAAFSGLFIGLKRSVMLLILLLGLVYCFGKGGWVIFMVGTFMIVLKTNKRLAVGLGVLFLVFGILFIYYNIQSKGAVPIHVRGFSEGVRSAVHHPLGTGLGSGGVYSALFALKRSLPAKESTLGSMLVQTGLPGTLAYVLFFFALIIQLSRLARPDAPSPDLSPVRLAARALSGCLAGIFLVTFFSESAVGVIGTGVFLVIAGSLQNFYPGPFGLKL